jgi:hypothetical protein
MNGRGRDPIKDWTEVSKRAAAASGVRPRVRPAPGHAIRSGGGVRPIAGWSVGGLVVAVAVVIAALSLRPSAAGPGASDAHGSAQSAGSSGPVASAGLDDPVVDRVDDGVFRLELTTPRTTYTPDVAIEPVATVTYLGPDPSIEVFHAAHPIGFMIDEVDGKRSMGGGMDQPCKTTTLTRGVPLAQPFMKGGSPDTVFGEPWYVDPVLRLPTGTWRIAAFLDVSAGDGGGCGAERHRLTASNVIDVVAGSSSPTASGAANPAPSLSADATVARELVRKYEDGLATGHEDIAWGFLSPWSQRDIGSLAAFVDRARALAQDAPGPVVVEDPNRDATVIAVALVGPRAADLAAVADPDRTFVVPVRRNGTDGTVASTEYLVVAPIDGEWLIWIDPAAGSSDASPEPSA